MTALLQPNQQATPRARRLIVVAWVALLLLWWATFPPRIVPRPLEVVASWRDLIHAGLLNDLSSSLWLNTEAIAWSTLISLALAYLTVLPAVKPFAGFVSKLRFLGFTGLTFCFGLVVTGHALKLWMLVFGMTVFYVTAMISVVANVPPEDYDYARTLRMSEWRVVWEMVVRGTLDQALETLRQNAAMGWMMLTMVEGWVRSEGGLGALMLNENKHFRLGAVFAIQLTILALGMLQDGMLGLLKRALCPWRR